MNGCGNNSDAGRPFEAEATEEPGADEISRQPRADELVVGAELPRQGIFALYAGEPILQSAGLTQAAIAYKQALVSNDRKAINEAGRKLLGGGRVYVYYITKKYCHGHLHLLADLLPYGMDGLLEAARRFEPERGFCFSTYCHWWVRSKVWRALQDEWYASPSRVPVHAADQVLSILRVAWRLKESTGREPSDEEIVQAIRAVDPANPHPISLETIRRARNQRPTLSLDRKTHPDSDVCLIDRVPLQTFSCPEDIVLACETLALVRRALERMCCVLEERVGSRCADVLLQRLDYKAAKHQTLQDIGDRLDLSSERIRQLEVQALNCAMRAFDLTAVELEGVFAAIPTLEMMASLDSRFDGDEGLDSESVEHIASICGRILNRRLIAYHRTRVVKPKVYSEKPATTHPVLPVMTLDEQKISAYAALYRVHQRNKEIGMFTLLPRKVLSRAGFGKKAERLLGLLEEEWWIKIEGVCRGQYAILFHSFEPPFPFIKNHPRLDAAALCKVLNALAVWPWVRRSAEDGTPQIHYYRNAIEASTTFGWDEPAITDALVRGGFVQLATDHLTLLPAAYQVIGKPVPACHSPT